MRKYFPNISLVLFLLVAACNNTKPDVTNFSSSLEAGNRILEDSGWYNWGVAPIYGNDGKVHAMVCRWPAETRMKGC